MGEIGRIHGIVFVDQDGKPVKPVPSEPLPRTQQCWMCVATLRISAEPVEGGLDGWGVRVYHPQGGGTNAHVQTYMADRVENVTVHSVGPIVQAVVEFHHSVLSEGEKE
jgi:hypothetical protein